MRQKISSFKNDFFSLVNIKIENLFFLFFFNKDEKVYIKFIIITVHNLTQSVGSCVVDRQGSSELI